MFDSIRQQVTTIFHDEPEHRIIDVCLTAAGTETDLFIVFSQFFCGGLSLRPCRDLDADIKAVSTKLRQCGMRCDITSSRDDQFSAFASLSLMMGDASVPVRFPIVRDGPGATISYFPTDSPGAYVSKACKFFHVDRSTEDDESRYFIPIVMSDGSVYTGSAPHCDIPLVTCPTHPYAVSSSSTYPVVVCRCGQGLESSFVCVHSGEEVRRVRFVPEINIGVTSGRRRCPGPQLAW